MPVLIELRLNASWPVRPDTRQLHGLACALFEREGSEHLGHDKPFGVWPLRAAPAGAGHDWEWRVAWLSAGPPPAGVIAPEQLRLGHVACTVTEATHRSVSHARLASGPPRQAVTVAFRSPTYFSQNGTATVMPDPRLIVGSWRRRWNAWLPAGAGLEVSDDAWHQVHRGLRLGRFELRTEARESGRGPERAGFTGTATLELEARAVGPAKGVLGTLARFAEFCGTGAQTTHGFGATTVATGAGES